MKKPHISDLGFLEAEAIFIIREVVAECKNPVLLFSGGKDSIVMIRLAQKAFFPGKIPFPFLHIDTEHNFPEVIEFRDRLSKELGARLIVRSVQDSIDQGRVKLRHADESRNVMQTTTLLDAIHEFGFDACFGGARRDEEKARAKERVFSFRDEFGQWDPKNQRPELWHLYNTFTHPGENIRVFPLSNWTELDVWHYIDQEKLDVPSIYYAHEREVVDRGGWLPLSHLVELKEGEQIEKRLVRFRTVGDMSCTFAVLSQAKNAKDILEETAVTRVTERGATRLDDRTSDESMELRKKEGYF